MYARTYVCRNVCMRDLTAEWERLTAETAAKELCHADHITNAPADSCVHTCSLKEPLDWR